MNKVIEYIIGAKDTTAEAISSAVERLKKYCSDVKTLSKKAISEAIANIREHGIAARDSIDIQDEAYKRLTKTAQRTYETLDQIQERIDAPKRIAEAAKKAQDEQNRALERYIKLCEKAKQREQERFARSISKGWNGQADGEQYALWNKRQASSASGGIAATTEQLKQLGQTAKTTAATTAIMAGSLSSLGGTAGKVSRSVSSVVTSILMFGAVGGIISGIQAGISLLAEHFVEKANEMLASVQEWAERVREKCQLIRDQNFNRFIGNLERVTKSVERSTEKFERMAASAKAMREAFDKTASAKGDSEIAGMEAELANRISAAPEDEKARIAAAGRLEIAERTAELTKESAERSAASERAELETMRKRVELARENANRLSAAKDKAQGEYDFVRNVPGAEKEAERYKQAVEAADERVRSAFNTYEKLKDELAASEQNLIANDIERSNAVTRAYTSAKTAESEYNHSESEYAKKIEAERLKSENEREQAEADMERKRLEAEKRIAQARMDAIRNEYAKRRELEADAQAALSAAQSNEAQAWGWYRNKDQWKAQLAEERANAEAEVQFEKEFKSLKRRRTAWRTAENLTDEEEIVRRVGLAREQREAAEDYARQTAEDTARAADALEEISNTLNEGSAE